LTNHNKDLNLDETAKKEGLDSPKVNDYSEAQQGLDSQPNMRALNTIEANVPTKATKKAKGGKKGRGNTAPGEGPRISRPSTREQMRCSNCLNPMTQSKNVNYQDITGKKVPKTAEGKPVFKSPNAAAGKLQGVLCDDCLRNAQAGKPVYITTAVVEDTNGDITNVPVSGLPNA